MEAGDDDAVYTVASTAPGAQLALTAAGYFARKAGPALASGPRSRGIAGEDELYADE